MKRTSNQRIALAFAVACCAGTARSDCADASSLLALHVELSRAEIATLSPEEASRHANRAARLLVAERQTLSPSGAARLRNLADLLERQARSGGTFFQDSGVFDAAIPLLDRLSCDPGFAPPLPSPDPAPAAARTESQANGNPLSVVARWWPLPSALLSALIGWQLYSRRDRRGGNGRIMVNLPLRIRIGDEDMTVTLVDVSVSGCKLGHKGAIASDAPPPLKLDLGGWRDARWRWGNAHFAGYRFNRRFSDEGLAEALAALRLQTKNGAPKDAA